MIKSGFAIIARAIASICYSRPDIATASRSSRSASRRKIRAILSINSTSLFFSGGATDNEAISMLSSCVCRRLIRNGEAASAAAVLTLSATAKGIYPVLVVFLASPVKNFM
jgi:hypothetical protein